MILTDYYRFEKLPNQKSKLRIDCVASTGGYEPFERLRSKGKLFFYIGDNTYTKAGTERKAAMALSKTTHISSMYNREPTLPYWFGDMKGEPDALLFVHQNAKFVNGGIRAGAVIDVFIARGQRNNREPLYNRLSDGKLDDEMKVLMESAVKEVNDSDKG